MCSCVQDVPMKWFLTKSSHMLQYGNIILQYTRRQYGDDPYCFTPNTIVYLLMVVRVVWDTQL